jgi:hypothetical protein
MPGRLKDLTIHVLTGYLVDYANVFVEKLEEGLDHKCSTLERKSGKYCSECGEALYKFRDRYTYIEGVEGAEKCEKKHCNKLFREATYKGLNFFVSEDAERIYLYANIQNFDYDDHGEVPYLDQFKEKLSTVRDLASKNGWKLGTYIEMTC